jgi:hypothetical protein
LTSRSAVSRCKCTLAVDGVTSASTASSVLVRARPSASEYSIRARAGSPIADAMGATAASASVTFIV